MQEKPQSEKFGAKFKCFRKSRGEIGFLVLKDAFRVLCEGLDCIENENQGIQQAEGEIVLDIV